MENEERIVPHQHEHLTRQLDIIPIDVLDQQINVIGAGAIGSVTVMTLAKMGFNNIVVYDHDVIDRVNISNQYYRFKDIGKMKVEALTEIVMDFTGVEILAIPVKWDGGCLNGIVITAVDSMAVRKQVYEAHIGANPKTLLIIDPRMSAEKALMYTYNPLDKESYTAYSNSLYSDHNAVQERCTAKATMYTSNLIGGLVAKTLKNFVCGESHSTYISWDINKDDLYVGKRTMTVDIPMSEARLLFGDAPILTEELAARAIPFTHSGEGYNEGIEPDLIVIDEPMSSDDIPF